MKILILGSTGLIGYGIGTYLYKNNKSFLGTHFISTQSQFWQSTYFNACNVELNELAEFIKESQVSHVINCIGVTKHISSIGDESSFDLNCIFPKKLTLACNLAKAKLIHVSTDCVYGDNLTQLRSEKDVPVPSDIYGLQKYLGETYLKHNAITIRTSTFSLEKNSSRGIVSWFMNSNTPVSGYTKAYFTGLSSQELGEKIIELIEKDVFDRPLLNISGSRISKYSFLRCLNQYREIPLEIIPKNDVLIDRCLDNALMEEVGISPVNNINDQLNELFTNYAEFYEV